MTSLFSRSLDQFLVIGFRLHDLASDFLMKHLYGTKRFLLVVAHLSLFGFLLPDLRKDFGELAANLLIVILFLSPLSKIFRMRLLMQLMSLRRELGILMAYLATVHGLGYLLDPEWFAVYIAPYWRTDFLAIEPRLLFGMTAYTLTLPLLLTSNNLAMRFLGGKKWKMLHRLVYLLFIAAASHRFLTKSIFAYDMFALFEAALLIGSYALAKLLAWKNFLAPLRDAITYVALRYKGYILKQKSLSAPAVL